MKKVLLPLLASPILLLAQTPPKQAPIEFPKHIDKCIDGYLYRAFLNRYNQIIPTSIHQVMEKSHLHHILLPKECKDTKESK